MGKRRSIIVRVGIRRALNGLVICLDICGTFSLLKDIDSVGPDDDNLSLSERRAETVAVTLSERLVIPAENLTTQGYGEQYPKVQTQGPERQNRRVTLRRITPLLAGQN